MCILQFIYMFYLQFRRHSKLEDVISLSSNDIVAIDRLMSIGVFELSSVGLDQREDATCIARAQAKQISDSQSLRRTMKLQA